MTWYIAIVRSGRHRQIENELASAGYRAFWPKLRKWVSHARTRTAKEYPVLGRYMFVEVPDGNFWAVSRIHGVDSMFSDGERPIAIGDDVVWKFRQRHLSGEWDFVRRDAKRPVFGTDGKGKQVIVDWEINEPMPVGARIRVVVGDFEDMLATITGRSGKKVDFKLFGRNEYGQLNESGVRAA